MTPADLAALAAAGLTRYAEGRLALDDEAALAAVMLVIRGHIIAALSERARVRALGEPWQFSLPSVDDAVARLKRELRR